LTISVTPLADHDLTGFVCGHPYIDNYIQSGAVWRDQKTRVRRNYVAVDRAGKVAGFLSLCPFVLPRGTMASSGILPALEEDSPTFIMLDCVAVTKMQQRTGLGCTLVRWAIGRARMASELVGGSALMLSSAPHLETFYAKFGFRRIDGNPDWWSCGQVVMYLPF
jgi:hypothetical protein